MKAIRIREFGAPEVMKIEDVADPTPGKGEIVVKVAAAGVNPVEAYIRSGLYPLTPGLPFTPGFDGAGVVEKIGEGVGRFRPDDRVYIAGSISGTYAEKVLCREEQVHILPDKIPFEQGAALGVPYATAHRALFHLAKARPGETLLIHGATGGVGTATVQTAKAAGLRIICTGGTEEGRRMLLEQGAHFVLNHHDEAHMDEVLRITEGVGADVVIEFLANVNLGKDLAALALKGRVVVIGSRGTVEIDPRQAMSRDAAILGMVLFNATDRELMSIHAAIGAGLETGILNPVIGRRYPLADAASAHHHIMETGAFGKKVLIP